jgi:signal transduction histidine kinase
MLRKLRIQLTLLYLLTGMVLVAIMGGWLYFRLANYFQTSTDLALKYRLAVELKSLKAPVSTEIEAAEKEFLNKVQPDRNLPGPTVTTSFTSTITPGNDTEGEGQVDPEGVSTGTLSYVTPNPAIASETETEDKEDGKEGSQVLPTFQPLVYPKFGYVVNPQKSGSSSLVLLAAAVQSQPTPVNTPEIQTTLVSSSHAEPDLDNELASELSSVYVLNLDNSGQLIAALNPYSTSFSTDMQAIEQARATGSAISTSIQSGGIPTRLLTYHLPDGYQADFIQIGRPIDDQTRLLNQYLTNLLAISLILLLLLGVGSWWLAGRSLIPAQKSLEQQQAFVANASHELRTPLTLIRASTELASRSTPAGETKELMGDVLQDVDYMSKLVEDLLLLSRLDNNRLVINSKPIQVKPFLDDLASQARLLSEKKGISVEVNSGEFVCLADPDRLRQVLWILVDNALQHTQSGTGIRITGQAKDNLGMIVVNDSGEGIPADDLPHIFDRFYKARNSRSQARGAGLGLSIARSLVEAQNGTIQIQSQHGRGTSVTVTLPSGKRSMI